MAIGCDSEIDDDADLDSELEDYSDTALIYDSDVDWTTEEVVTTSQSFVPNLHSTGTSQIPLPLSDVISYGNDFKMESSCQTDNNATVDNMDYVGADSSNHNTDSESDSSPLNHAY